MTFRFLTAGESHGKALVGVIEGLPAGVPILKEDIMADARRRKQGHGRGARQKIETDDIEIISGVRHGRTLGSPVSLMLANKDFDSWKETMQVAPLEGKVKREVHVPRPGHADLIGGIKYGHKDMRNVLERSSARETAMRVALGSVARRFLQCVDIHVASRVVRIGPAADASDLGPRSVCELNLLTDKSPVRCLCPEAEAAMISAIDQAKSRGDTLGGVFEVIADGLPQGLGSYSQWDRRIEASIGAAFLSLNAIKGVEVGLGFRVAELPGSEVHDSFYPSECEAKKVTYRSNRSGGIDGGMTTGEPIVVRAAMKPIATLMRPLDSVNLQSGQAVKAHVERSDTCAVPAAAVIGEALLCLVLAKEVLEKFGGDSLGEIQERVMAWRS